MTRHEYRVILDKIKSRIAQTNWSIYKKMATKKTAAKSTAKKTTTKKKATRKTTSSVATGNLVELHYKGSFPDGTQFDSSYDRGQTISVQVGQGQLIKGFENEDHGLIISLFADSVKWNGPEKKLLNQSISFNEVSDAIKGFLAIYDNHSFKNAIYAGGNTFRYDAKTSSSPDNVRIYGNWYHTHSESKKEVTHKWFAQLRFNKDGKVTRINHFYDVTGFRSQHIDK